MVQKNTLGKGLGAILPDLTYDLSNKPSFILCGIEELYPNRFQPRKDFNDADQKQLAASVKKSGIIQPIVVRKTDRGYEIIAGERRWRAAQAAGLQEVPVIIREAKDVELAELSLIENIQRAELNALEEAQAYQTLMAEFDLSQEEISSRVGKDRSTIANTIRLLKLPNDAKAALVQKKITPGHARALLALEAPVSQIGVLKLVLKKDLTVRDTERIIKNLYTAPQGRKAAVRDPHLADLERKLSSRLAAPARIKVGKKGGSLEIVFRSNEDLSRLLKIIMG